jgi:hypothetical protein
MNELTAFVREALAAGHDRAEVRDVLRSAGWPEDEVNDALSRFAEAAFPIPVPRRRYSTSAQETFLYLVTFAALYTAAIALGALLFGIVDYYLPDPVRGGYAPSEWELGALRWNMASLIVAFPVYLWLTRMHLGQYAKDPERRTSAVRRWLTYLTLFVASVVVIGTMITLLGNLLGGELPWRIVLKSAVALAISTAVLAYYLWEMRSVHKATAQ